MIGSDRALVRVLSNLVANAIAHTPGGGTVELAIGSDEHGAWARVDDTGVGIDEADLARVFDVAYRGSNGRVPRDDSSLPSGSGLGLAIAAGPGARPPRHGVGLQPATPAPASRCGCRWPARSDASREADTGRSVSVAGYVPSTKVDASVRVDRSPEADAMYRASESSADAS